MRKIPPSDADRSGPWAEPPAGPQPPAVDAAASDPTSTDDPGTAPALVWPPADDEMNDWEVLQLHSSGNTVIEPLKYTPPAPPAAASRSGERPVFTPPTPAPYVPPPPIDDPVGEASLLQPPSTDFDLPETELIEPLHTSNTGTMPAMPAVSGARPAAFPAPMPLPEPGDDCTIIIPRPAGLTPPAATRPDIADDANANQATRILVSPNFAATVGHAPTVPVSALHRAAVPPRPEPGTNRGDTIRPMEDTLPAGVTRELLAQSFELGDETTIQPAPTPDTHPLAAVPRPGPVAVPGPFSRVPSRGPQPVVPAGAPPASAPPAFTFAPQPDPAPAPTEPRMRPPAAPGAAVPARVTPPSTRAQLTWLAIGVAALVVIGVGVYQYLSMRDTSAAALAPATLSVDSTPAGAAVSIDGTPRGKTPLRLELAEGAHTLDVTAGGSTKHIPLALVAGTVTAHTLEFALPTAAAAAADSAIEIAVSRRAGACSSTASRAASRRLS